MDGEIGKPHRIRKSIQVLSTSLNNRLVERSYGSSAARSKVITPDDNTSLEVVPENEVEALGETQKIIPISLSAKSGTVLSHHPDMKLNLHSKPESIDGTSEVH